MMHSVRRQNLFSGKLFHSLALFVAMAAIALVLPSFAQAQAPKGNLPPHGASLTWANGIDPSGTTITGSNVYRCPGTCSTTTGTFTLLTTTPLPATTLSYADNAVVANTTYSWSVTNLVTLSTGPFETASSNVVTATIPKDQASGPTGLAVAVQ